MKTQRRASRFTTAVELFKSAVALVGEMSFPRPLVPGRVVPVRPAARILNRPARRTVTFTILLTLLALASAPAWAGQAALPEGVPNIFDPQVRAKFQPVAVVNLRGNPDFPMLLLVNTAGEQPQAIVLGLDARNGKDTWSLASDPIILIALFSDPATILAVHVDTGFSEKGKPSGTYLVMENPGSLNLPDLFKAIAATPARAYL